MSDLAGESAPAKGAVRSRATTHPVLLPAIVGCAMLMQSMSATSIANALPTMAHAMHESPITLNMAITSFLLAAAVCLPLSGWAADRFGARPVFLLAMVTFALSSVACGFAHSLPELVCARVVQGAASSMMMPVGRLIVLRSVPKSELVGALAILTMPGMLGPMIGPALGGFIVTYGDWRWIFFMNLPVGVIAVVLIAIFVPNIREEEKRRLDLTGFALSGVACAGLVFGFENIGRSFLPPWMVAALLIGGGVCGWLFFAHAKRTENPILDPAIFKRNTFSTSILGGSFLRFAMGASPFLLAMLLQLGFGLSAFQAGLTTLAAAAGSFGMKTVAPPLIRRFGFKKILIVNGVIAAGLFGIQALLRADTPYVVIFLTLFASGFFRSLQFTCLNSLAYADVPREEMSRASSISAMGQQLSQSIGVGLAGVLLHATMQAQGLDHITASAVSPVFAAMGAITLISLFWYVRLPDNAGDDMRAPARRVADAT